ncbi:MAG: hypothetical protein HY744_01215 [Deltaproteobacteria bacterium]|nr:hypothetical protein [Deltaproteobacteria bacterium]
MGSRSSGSEPNGLPARHGADGRRGRIAAALLAAVALPFFGAAAGCSRVDDDATAGCTKDSDCKGNRICVAGACREPVAATPAGGCKQDSDCSAGQSCASGKCESRAVSTAAAPPASVAPASTAGAEDDVGQADLPCPPGSDTGC